MKKGLFIVGIALLSLSLFGCGKEETKKDDDKKTVVTECMRTGTIQEGVDVDFSYKVTSKDGVVQLVETEEKIVSSDEDYLESFKTTVEAQYAPYKDLEYYEYSVSLDGDTLISKTKINYGKLDADELIDIDSANAQLFEDGKVKLDTLKTVYETLGAVCEEK